MTVRVTKPFDWAPDGNHPRTVAVGEVLEGRGATIALELKSGEVVSEPMTASGPHLFRRLRLPTRNEFAAAGYDESQYEAFISSETTRAEAAGVRAEIRPPTPEEVPEPPSQTASAKPTADAHSAPIAVAVEPQPTTPSPESPLPPAAEPKRKNKHGR